MSISGAPDALSAKGILELPIGTWWFKNLSIKGGLVSIRSLIPQLEALIDYGKAKLSFAFDKEITIEEASKVYMEFSDHNFIKAHIRFDEHINHVPKKRKKME
jgi:threonine dehydrogenase-like Zn-dependent dehydrogenase